VRTRARADRGGRIRGCRFEPKEKDVKSDEHRRSRRDAPVDTRTPEEAALARAVVLARVLRWREEWQAEIAARQAEREGRKPNGQTPPDAAPRPQRRDGNAGQFAAGVARSELGRFYWDSKLAAGLPKSRGGRTTKKSTKPKRE